MQSSKQDIGKMAAQHVFIVAQAEARIAQVVQRLEQKGHKVTLFSEAIGAVAAINRSAPDLVVIDSDRPLVSALTLCELLRKSARLVQTPVIILTQFDDPQNRYQKAVAAGAQGSVNSTQPPDEVTAQILRYLVRRHPLLPVTESQRMERLRSYRVLDTPPESVFDDLVRIASVVCETPIALISLVDTHRQWFKARVGLDATETPREDAFCAHAIHHPDLMEIPDATKDIRFADNPLVLGAPDIRFYAGAPLTATDGTAAGTLCVIDRKQRQLRPSQREALTALGRVAVHLLEQRVAR